MWHGCRAPIRSRQHSAPLIPAARGREANPDGGGREANPGGGGANPVDPRWIRLVGMMSSSSLLSFLSSMPTQLPDILTLGGKKQASGSNVLDVVYVAAGTRTWALAWCMWRCWLVHGKNFWRWLLV
ncbi:hypothetical protein BDA96_01G282700 [Sorghum bicolor]|uniref:Uncharacterized protein n=1 Tax=Sorghum bicolor TaxID=4558 RepID=A0A921S1Q1_SORBI|nr:uncharacterized protein LOC110433297 [Sorghum bicolor]KAG0549765.1 hypothetical protein BDA96_01G282700 [Sorghum bicolor]|eukprot:XP_021310803.1 uncharacterized protein LOC110433297 [Sorghum bicolor]